MFRSVLFVTLSFGLTASANDDCAVLVEGEVFGSDPSLTLLRCADPCSACPSLPSDVSYYGPFDLVGATDIADGESTPLTILPAPGVPAIPVDPCGDERLTGVVVVWEWEAEYPSGAGNQFVASLGLRLPGDQVYLDYQEAFPGMFPKCVSFEAPAIEFVRSDRDDPLAPEGCGPTPDGDVPGAFTWRVAMPRMGRDDELSPWMPLVDALNAGQAATSADLVVHATLPAGATLRTGMPQARVYFWTELRPKWGDLMLTAPASEFEETGPRERGLIYLNSNNDSGSTGMSDAEESDPQSKFLHGETLIAPALAHDVMMSDDPLLVGEFPYISHIDRQLTPIVIDMPCDWQELQGARLRLAEGSADCRLWMLRDIGDGGGAEPCAESGSPDGDYDCIEPYEFPLEFDFENGGGQEEPGVFEFCRILGRPFDGPTICTTAGWGQPYALMLESIGTLDDEITLILEYKRNNAWVPADEVTLASIGFGLYINSTQGVAFSPPSLEGYEIPTLKASGEYAPEPYRLDLRMLPVSLEAPVSFLELNWNPIAGLHLGPGLQFVIERPREIGQPGDPRFVTLDSIPNGFWPGFEVVSRQYFKLHVQSDMTAGEWDPFFDRLYIAHWPDDERLDDGSGALVAGGGGSGNGGVDMATGMCGAGMGDTQVPCDGGCCGVSGDDCEEFEPPCDQCPCPESGGEHITDPIYLFSGEVYLEEVDLRIPGRGRDFVWKRKYRSKAGPDTCQGAGWDCSWDIYLEQTHPGDVESPLVVHDGNSRRDIYYPQPDGSWSRRGYFRDIVQEMDGSFTLTFADRAYWTFHPFDGSSAGGRLASQVDRNGNAISLSYDVRGRVSTITDTLGRDITIGYNTDGFIATVTDFIGRAVRYEYYQDGDADGSAGDLKSVTTPAVVGTPHGNDFPDGKTTVYTWTVGFEDERLNHNLLSITDPKGQTFVTNVYATTEDPSDDDFDRVVRQIWGDQDPKHGDIIDLWYGRVTPEVENNFAVSQTVLNDRVGNVKEYFYDERNQLVLFREYTGRADPDQPTTRTVNRPVAPLRPGHDPAYFETRTEYNDDALPILVTHPNGNQTGYVYESDLNPGASTRTRGNLRELYHFPGPLGGDQDVIVEYFEYDDDHGSCCGGIFVSRHIDGRGNDTLHEYDEFGNRVRTVHRIRSIVEEWRYNEYGQLIRQIHPDNGSGHQRVDAFTYYESGPQTGYLQSEIIDAPHDHPLDPPDPPEVTSHFALTTTYEYDAVGNVVRVIDPRGNDTLYEFNALNQRVRELSRPVRDGIRYETLWHYDANDNMVRVDVENRDETGALQANTHFSTLYEYEILNHQIRRWQEIGGSFGLGTTPQQAKLDLHDFVVTEYEYDANRNRTLVRYGEATNGNDPFNIERTYYDERDLTYRLVRAEGDPEDQSTAQYDYDANGNIVVERSGLEADSETDGGDGGPSRVTIHQYDGYDRLIRMIDPMGNVTEHHYDSNGNRGGDASDGDPNAFATRVLGELEDLVGSGGNVRLAERMHHYDPMDRRVLTVEAFFDTETQIAIGDGESTTATVYSGASQVREVENDNGNVRSTYYDTANRVSRIVDAKGNVVTLAYDANSNITSRHEAEVHDLAGIPNDEFVTLSVFDGLNRLIARTDNVGNRMRRGYDSRGNKAVLVDTRRNVTRWSYDGLNRLLSTEYELTDSGDGAGAVVDIVTTKQVWDDSSRLVAQIDDNGNATRYHYDALGRRSVEEFADGTRRTLRFDVHGNTVLSIDSNGSQVVSRYDRNDRQVGCQIAPGPGISRDTTFERYGYDGLSRMVIAEDDDALVTRAYDSRSGVIRETLNGETTQAEFDGVGNHIRCVYPGGRTVDTTYDELERKKMISDENGLVAEYWYVGPGRVERRQNGNGTRLDYSYDGITGIPNPAGDAGVRKVVRTTHSRIADGAIIDDRRYRWDAMGNKVRRVDIRAGGPRLVHDYEYDSLSRLGRTIVADGVGATLRDEHYTYDGVGNRLAVKGGSNPGDYECVAGNGLADCQMNQYTETPFDAREYDANGNLLRVRGDTVRAYEYDYRNRLVRLSDFTTEATSGNVVTYRYDALGRRIEKIVGDGNRGTQYFYHGWQVCEERDARGITSTTYVYGLYIDEVLQRSRNGERFYFHADDQFNVMVVTSGAGIPVERYEYGDFGNASFFDASGATLEDSAIGNAYLFTGRTRDSESELYYYRTRYLDTESGRFIGRDSMGLWGDRVNLGNPRVLAGNNAWSRLDPFGLFCVTQNWNIKGPMPVLFGLASFSIRVQLVSCPSTCDCYVPSPSARNAYTHKLALAGSITAGMKIPWTSVGLSFASAGVAASTEWGERCDGSLFGLEEACGHVVLWWGVAGSIGFGDWSVSGGYRKKCEGVACVARHAPTSPYVKQGFQCSAWEWGGGIGVSGQ